MLEANPELLICYLIFQHFVMRNRFPHDVLFDFAAMKGILTLVLFTISNLFMTFAWYGHL